MQAIPTFGRYSHRDLVLPGAIMLNFFLNSGQGTEPQYYRRGVSRENSVWIFTTSEPMAENILLKEADKEGPSFLEIDHRFGDPTIANQVPELHITASPYGLIHESYYPLPQKKGLRDGIRTVSIHIPGEFVKVKSLWNREVVEREAKKSLYLGLECSWWIDGLWRLSLTGRNPGPYPQEARDHFEGLLGTAPPLHLFEDAASRPDRRRELDSDELAQLIQEEEQHRLRKLVDEVFYAREPLAEYHVLMDKLYLKLEEIVAVCRADPAWEG